MGGKSANLIAHSVIDQTDSQPKSADPTPKWGRAIMHAYRCYLLDAAHHIATVEIIECADDGEAERRGEEVLAAHPECAGVEVWDSDRRVHVRMLSDVA
jgi:hypothetical protein